MRALARTLAGVAGIALLGAVNMGGCGGGGGGGGGGGPAGAPAPTVPTLALSAVALSFAASEGGASPSAQSVQISNPGPGGALDWFARTSSAWLSVDVEAGVTPAALTISAQTDSYPAGVYRGKVWISSPSAETALVDVTFTVAGAPPGPGAKWTIMLYINGDNDLETFALEDMNELEAAAASADVNLIVLLDRHPSAQADGGAGYTDADGDWSEARLYVVSPDADPLAITSPIVDQAEINMGDPALLRILLDFGISFYPAERYGLVIWNHGNSWKTTGFDETSADDLTLPEVRTAIEQALSSTGEAALDLVVFDQCLNGSLEAAYQLSGLALAMVGSQELAPGDGMDYTATLNALAASPAMGGLELGQQFARDYIQSYSAPPPGNPTVTCSVLDLRGVDGAAAAAHDLAVALGVDMDNQFPRIGQALASLETYGQDEYADLSTFARLVRDLTANPDVAAAAENLMEAVHELVFYHDNGADRFYSYGVTVYAPASYLNFDSAYSSASFAADTAWDEMVVTYYLAIIFDTTAPTVTDLNASSSSAGQTSPVTLTATLDGDDIAAACLYAGQVNGSVVTLLFVVDVEGPTGLLLSNGQPIPDWSAGSTPLDVTWDTTAFVVTNGVDGAFATTTSGATCLTVDAVHRSSGLADDKPVTLIFHCDGALVACYETPENGAPREIELGIGDELDIYTQAIDFADPSAPQIDMILQGTLTVGGLGIGIVAAPVPDGDYAAGICAQDFAGNTGAEDLLLTVDN